MPPVTRWFLRSAVLYLVASLWAGILVVVPRVMPHAPRLLSALGPTYVHAFMVGWVTQMIFGVAFWMFPKAERARPRGNERLVWISFWLLNAGLFLRVVAEPLNAMAPGALWGWLLVPSALFQWAAGLAFAGNLWGRIKGKMAP
ncbi:MAG: hypothetical protein Q9O62_02455 [Ardenticatenia bacterium]|nr:hypothetical protein [Ardenticatenia bacterium]